MKVMLGAGLLALAAISFAGAKSCEILLPQPTYAGSTTLAPGQYRVEVQGSSAVFTNVLTGYAFAAPVQVATTTNHEDTAIRVDKRNGNRFLKSIELGNSDQTLRFE